MAFVRFFSEDTDFKLRHPRKTSLWLNQAAQKEKKKISSLSIIFTSDDFLFDLNHTFLHHNSLTDVITFDLADGGDIDGEIYISLDRVKENAARFNSSFDEELHRVMIHGLLHLLGYFDKTKPQKAQIRKKEEAYLSLRW
jgi:probable rRNA maturation factor